MLSMIGLILKVIGMILLVLLCILVTVVLLILFVPLRYKASVVRTKEMLQADIHAGWLFGILSFHFRLQGKAKKTKLRFLFFTLYNSDKPKKRKKKAEKVPEEAKDTSPADSTDKAAETGEETVLKQTAEEQMPEEESRVREEDELPKDAGVFEKIGYKIHVQKKKLKDKLLGILAGLREKADKIERIKEELLQLKTMYWNEEKKKIYKRAWDRLKKIIKHILPRKIKGKIEYGTGDPYSTGTVFSYLGMFYALYGKHIRVDADFENKKLDVQFKLRGRIRCFTVLLHIIKLLNKDFRRLIKEAGNIKNRFNAV